MRRALIAAAITAVVLAGCGSVKEPPAEGVSAHLTANGPVKFETGDFYSNTFSDATGSISIDALDTGGRVTPLPPHDQIGIDAAIQSPQGTYTITAHDPMVEDMLGRWTTWWGVGLDVAHHGNSGIGTNKLPTITSPLAAFAMGDVSLDGKLIASGVPVHVMTADTGLPGKLELDVGDPMAPLAALRDGHLRILWASYDGSVPQTIKTERYVGGGIVLVLLVAAGLWLNRRPRARVSARG